MDEQNVLEQIGSRIKDLRISKQMTQDNLAEKCN